MAFRLIPAVDIVDGQAVRLTRGEAGTETPYGEPLEAARRFAAAGASWLHVVDLDAAFGRGSNHEHVAAIASGTDLRLDVTGGIREQAAFDRAVAAGAARVTLGTAVFKNPEWAAGVIAEHPDLVAVDLAAVERDGGWRAAVSGWQEDAGDLWEVLESLDQAGVRRIVVTDVSRDGALTGPNIELLREVSAATDARVTASGGVSSIGDVEALAALEDEGIDEAIVGKALYEGGLDLAEALKVVTG
ncbi:bifunctional 1-(5-phosphoribosyl)-5-((5-phosphoribosylamino)methylideneamino)imidazole-4-carboxamide isomerase/phosphoribosylanthranilate isomerase PriA [Corynebacterium otitidis]|uniref:1-(5-phosphoribosyl)-5-[(5-phosphoribosylamino)methylideneamino] imidazole-4-carboxamide isomerase n=1 Tax=Corynebacterium otitidis ATCC 51513 TaxID=883169 RepID=I7JVL5_9CORY|nr:bifunctional 1-(5-phosphoribosyl)-5-((5-phosphoribosylamino)methylideneamino)imidazole-4-carboxamide isomerase/phosphoribosylanthranilate isomerase PriA [Corynebacterium otitidis]EJZ82858.1 bifunctional HisA/TrpF protein [Corynebacterium otitidis ATCC 51513]CCI83046.1 phosphoribosyl isomerase A [Corynebacterium otitidis ATCC 51513]